MTIYEFIEKCQKRPLPSNSIARIKMLARELAEGAGNHIWHTIFLAECLVPPRSRDNNTINSSQDSIDLVQYLLQRWSDNYPRPDLLLAKGYLAPEQETLTSGWMPVSASTTYQIRYRITDKALDLLDETEPSTIFISYKRSESSAFALLVENRLTQANLSPFLDKQLQAGDDWHKSLEERIKKSDYFILLLGEETLKSNITVQEIRWAIEDGVTIIPIWHNGFEYKQGTWGNIPVEVDRVLANTHTIRVIEENPLTYDTALRELLNRFGISG